MKALYNSELVFYFKILNPEPISGIEPVGYTCVRLSGCDLGLFAHDLILEESEKQRSEIASFLELPIDNVVPICKEEYEAANQADDCDDDEDDDFLDD